MKKRLIVLWLLTACRDKPNHCEVRMIDKDTIRGILQVINQDANGKRDTIGIPGKMFSVNQDGRKWDSFVPAGGGHWVNRPQAVK